jgi:hypothetical protein
MLILKENF